MLLRTTGRRLSQIIFKQSFPGPKNANVLRPVIKKSIVPSSTRWATSVQTPSLATMDPAHAQATALLEEGTKLLEDGDVEGALKKYARSVEVHSTASGLFNLGVTHYHLKQFEQAIEAWKSAIVLDPSSADAHTNLASAYIMSPPAQPLLALEHLRIAASLVPEDGEIAFNLAAVLEACGHLEEALNYYKRSQQFGIDRAEQNIRNVSTKIFGKRLQEAGAAPTKEDIGKGGP